MERSAVNSVEDSTSKNCNITTMFRPHEGARLYTRVLLESHEGRGFGMFAKDEIPCGATIVDELPAIIGPKSSDSPLVCMECLSPLSRTVQENGSFDGNKGQEKLVIENMPEMVQCKKCGMPLCNRCSLKLEAISIQNTSQYSAEDESSTSYYHLDECQIFQNAGFKNLPLKNLKSIQQVYSILAPLRLLIAAKKNPALLDLEDMADARKNTLLYHYNAMNVVKRIQHILKCKPEESTTNGQLSFTSEEIHKVCGILDTNAFELSWSGRAENEEGGEFVNAIRARGLFPLISRLNHDCIPNCRKYFCIDKSPGGDSRIVMVVKASRHIEAGEEITISYTPPFFNTSVRQMILSQTKNFVCKCKRCLDPTEFGSCLSGLRCRDCNTNNKNTMEKDSNVGVLLPIDPTNTNSDLICATCASTMPSERAKMEVDTVLKFVGQNFLQGVESNDKEYSSTTKTLETMAQMGRFLAPTHQILMDLKLRFISQIEEQAKLEKDYTLPTETKDVLQMFFEDILQVLTKIAPGESKLRGSVSKRYHELNDRYNLKLKNESAIHDMVLPKDTIIEMFKNDMTFAANQTVDSKDLR